MLPAQSPWWKEVRSWQSTITSILITAHLAMLLLHITDLAAPAIPPTIGLNGALGVVDDRWWMFVHATSAGLLAIALWRDTWRAGVLGGALGSVTWLIWMGLLLQWSLHTVPPVSLTAPLLGLLVCLPLSVICTASWSDHNLY